MSKPEKELKERINKVLEQKIAECDIDTLPDHEHGYVDALLWLQDGSIQLTREGIKKELKEREFADKNESKAYYDGYDSALEDFLKLL